MTAETPTPRTKEVDCPECHKQCWWCSNYLWMIRSLGCCANTKRRDPNSCRVATDEKGKTCATCDTAPNTHSGGRVMLNYQYTRIQP